MNRWWLMGWWVLFPFSIFAIGERIPAGGKTAATGGTGVAEYDLWAVFHNPGGLAGLESLSAGIATDNRFLLSAISRQHLAVAIPFRIGVTALAVSRYGNPLYRELLTGIAFARHFGRKFSAGIRFDYLSQSTAIRDKPLNLFSFGLGMTFYPRSNLGFGLHVLHPYPIAIAEYPPEYLPVTLTMGLSWQVSASLRLAAEADKNFHTPLSVKAGAEYRVGKLVMARLGFSTAPLEFSFGAGIRSGQITFELASRYHPILGFSPAASLIFQTKKRKQ